MFNKDNSLIVKRIKDTSFPKEGGGKVKLISEVNSK